MPEKTELYRKVFINGDEKNLPKDGGIYIWHNKNAGLIDPLQPLFYDKELDAYLLQRFDWYLQPEPEGGKSKEERLCESCAYVHLCVCPNALRTM